MPTRTYTLLVTVTDDNLPDAPELARRVAHCLETGAAGHPYLMSAQVDAVAGDYVYSAPHVTISMKALHKHLRTD